MASQMEDRRGCFGRHYVSEPMALPMCHREGGQRRKRWKKKKSQQRQQQQQQRNRARSNSSITDDGTRRGGRQLTGEWSRASRSSLVRPAFPRLASPLLRRPFFSADTRDGGEDAERRRLSSPRRRAIAAPPPPPGYTRDVYVAIQCAGLCRRR